MEIPVEIYNQSSQERLAIKSKWWGQPEETLHAHVFGVVKQIRQRQSYRQQANILYARLYANMDTATLTGAMFQNNTAVNFKNQSNKVTYNVIRACIDTATAKIAKNKPKPLYLTDDGSFAIQQRSQLLTAYVAGYFDRMGTGQGGDRSLYGIGKNSFLDCALWGTGITKFFKCPKEHIVKAERVFIDEIVVDEAEGRYRNPRQIHHIKLVHREVAMSLWPEFKVQIAAAPSGLPPGEVNASSADMIEVLESWHLPSSMDSKDGVHAICIENCTLFREDYTKDYFPFLFMRWAVNPLGFFGRGIAEELVGLQLEINTILRVIQIAQHLVAVPQVWLDIQSKVVTKHLNNQIGGVKFYTGREPRFFTPTAMTSEMYSWLETLYNKSFELTGISQLSASSKKPAGIDAAVALREYQDIETERFSLVSEMYQDWFIDAANLLHAMNDELLDEGYNVKVLVKDSASYMRNLSWRDVRINQKSLVVKAWPVNLLPSSPSGKLQKTQELVQAGIFTQEEALELLDFPDVSSVTSMKLAPRNAVRKIVEHNLEKGETDYISPEPEMNLEFARVYAQNYYLLGRSTEMPEKQLEILQRFMEDVKNLLQPPQEALPPVMPQDPNQAMPLPPVVGEAILPPPQALVDAGVGESAGAADLAASEAQAVAQAAPVSDLLQPQV